MSEPAGKTKGKKKGAKKKGAKKKGAKKGAKKKVQSSGAKAIVAKPRQVLGKPSNNVAIGIVGMPNIGKSTLFNCMTKLNVAASNFPFCTIKPTEAKVPVPDPRFDHLAKHFAPKKEIPAVLTVTDIAGLVKGAHEGKGLGNEFLSNIAAVDAIYHVCRAFKAKDIEHVEGAVDPCRDLDIISHELISKDIQVLSTKVEQMDKDCKRAGNKLTKARQVELDVHKKALELLQGGTDIREHLWKEAEVPVVNSMHMLTAKPIVYLVNVRDKDYIKGGNKWFKSIREWVNKRSPGAPCVPFSASFEQEWINMDDDAKKASGRGSMIPKITITGYHIMNMIHFFTCGDDEVRAWTIKGGCLAPRAGAVIHSDFETGFVKVEQYHYDDYVEYDNSEQAVRIGGKMRTQGRKYEVKDGDILFFHSGKSSGKKR